MRSAWTGFLLSISLCLDLGLVNVAILRTSLERGGVAGFLLGVGSSVGDLAYFTVAVFGATAVLRWAPVRWTLWLAGTAVLLLLACRMAREVIRPQKIDVPPPSLERGGGPFALLVVGAGLALASPSAILWFAAVGGSVIATFGGDRHSLAGFTAGFLAGGLAWSVVFAFGAAQLSRILGRNLVRALSLLAAILFLYFAAVVFIRGAREMI